MVTVALLNEQTPATPKLTVRPELAVAATGNVVLYAAVAGAANDTVIVWLAWLMVIVPVPVAFP
jgi:hypothetical protein